ncbi:hypothetical protein L198_01293 [Cryptococcus wingfieldii CBS 7118]|uniref:Uncharacterized protein n=1 Tax=Cryptococcus wingfieldii CBS 7118 TaxID=1295528 RepID=A0A1E3JYT6_9TREE|nr:hypothetical protein L198_01293 [Cryptococcus wingfieldii CBS 7118]ODO06064.1 hypothetical protein L198_01293 [Cryptococcus wingfieldii CBS 7118]
MSKAHPEIKNTHASPPSCHDIAPLAVLPEELPNRVYSFLCVNTRRAQTLIVARLPKSHHHRFIPDLYERLQVTEEILDRGFFKGLLNGVDDDAEGGSRSTRRRALALQRDLLGYCKSVVNTSLYAWAAIKDAIKPATSPPIGRPAVPTSTFSIPSPLPSSTDREEEPHTASHGAGDATETNASTPTPYDPGHQTQPAADQPPPSRPAVDRGQSSSAAPPPLLTYKPLYRCNNPSDNAHSDFNVPQSAATSASHHPWLTDSSANNRPPLPLDDPSSSTSPTSMLRAAPTPTLKPPGSINPNQVPWGGGQQGQAGGGRERPFLGGAADEEVESVEESGDDNNGENGEEERLHRQTTSEASSASTPSSNATDAAFEQNRLMPRWG